MHPAERVLQAAEAHVDALHDALKKHYLRFADAHFATEEGKHALFEHAIRRTRLCATTVVPWIKMFTDMTDSKVVEIGSGTGAFSVALAAECREVAAYEIGDDADQMARARAEILGLDNIRRHCLEPERLIESVVAEHTDSADIVLLFATLEHQTISERLASLRAAWQVLREDGLLVVGGTPNRLVFCQTHTARMPFFDMLPDELSIHFFDRSPNKAFVRAIQRRLDSGATDEIPHLIDRWGRGVSFHEFEVALGDLFPITLAHGFEEPWMRAPLSLEERLLIKYFREMRIPAPLGFARQNIAVILQKRSGKDVPPTKWVNKFKPDAVL